VHADVGNNARRKRYKVYCKGGVGAVGGMLPCLSRLALPSLSAISIGSSHGTGAIARRRSRSLSRSASHTAPPLASADPPFEGAVKGERIEERCVGFVAVSQFTRVGSCKTIGAPVVFVDELFVDPTYRKVGIARLLLKRAIAAQCLASDASVALIVRWSADQQSAARRLYEDLGLRPTQPLAMTEPVPDRPGKRRIVALRPENNRNSPNMEKYLEATVGVVMHNINRHLTHRGAQLQRLCVDTQAKQADEFLQDKDNTHITTLSIAHHLHSSGSDGADLAALLRESNIGVYGAYVPVAVSATTMCT